jgi:cytochrome d ubiquinol oxidase subunit II
MILFALIIRGVAFEFRGKGESETWKKGWDIFQGLPMDANGYHGTLFTLLNSYGLLTGVLFVLLFIVHGALWLSFKTNDNISERASGIANNVWYPLVAVAVIFLAYIAFATNLYSNYISNLIWFVIPVIAVLALLGIRLFISKGQPVKAFYTSCITILMVIFTGVIGLYPNLIPSSIDPQYSLTIFNSSSSDYTLKIMTVVALLLVPIVIAYQIWIYRIFRQKVTKEDIIKDKEAY